MKLFLLAALLLTSLSAMAQGALLEADKDKLLPGPSFFKLGLGSDHKLQETDGGRFHSPIKGKNKVIQAQINKLSAKDKTMYKPTIVCSGETNILNGVIVISKLRACFQTIDGKLIFNSTDLGPTDVMNERTRVSKFVNGQLDAYSEQNSKDQNTKDPKQNTNDRSPGLPGQADDGYIQSKKHGVKQEN